MALTVGGTTISLSDEQYAHAHRLITLSPLPSSTTANHSQPSNCEDEAIKGNYKLYIYSYLKLMTSNLHIASD